MSWASGRGLIEGSSAAGERRGLLGKGRLDRGNRDSSKNGESGRESADGGGRHALGLVKEPHCDGWRVSPQEAKLSISRALPENWVR